MKKSLLFLALSFHIMVQAQIPEMIYLKFNSSGTQTNQSPAATRVFTTATITGTGLSVGGTGLSGTALLGSSTTSTSGVINTGWNTSLTGSWTLAFWSSNYQPSSTLFYIFGDAGAGSFRCFTNGAAGANNWLLRATGMTDVTITNGADTGSHMIHFVHDATANVIRGYKDGVLVTSVSQTSGMSITSGTGFQIGGYASNTGIATGAKMDEFRLYNRALTASEITTTYNTELFSSSCTGKPTLGSVIANSGVVCAGKPIQLSISSLPSGSGVSYQWQRSTSSATGPWNSPVSDTFPTLSFTPGTATWFRAIATCDSTTLKDTTAAYYIGTASAPLSGVYTINSTMATGGRNFSSIADFITLLNCSGISASVTANIVANTGPYSGPVSFGAISGVSATKTITINGNGNAIESSTSPIMSFSGSSFITVRNCNIIGSSSFVGFGVHLSGASKNISLIKNTINVGTTSTSTLTGGIIVSGSTTSATTVGNNAQNLIIDSNEIIGGYYGMTLIGNISYMNNTGHKVTNNKISDYYLYGLYMIHGDTIQIEGNDMNRATRGTLSTFYGVYMNLSRNIKVRKNSIHDGGVGTYTAYPIYIANSVNTVGYETEFSNNQIYNINTTGTFYGLYSVTTALNGVKIYHNTIQHASATGTGALRGMFLSVAMTNVDIRNNIISISGAATGVKYCVYVTSATNTNLTMDRNVYYINSSGGTNSIGYWTANRTSLSNWQTASSQDANSVDSDPIFTSLINGDLTPISVSCDNIGTPVGVTKDIINRTRSASTPDPGAYEFVGVTSDLSLSTGSLARSSICYTLSDTVKLTVRRSVGPTLNFANDSLVMNWYVNGPVASSGTMVIKNGTLTNGSFATFTSTGVNFSKPGNYTLNAYIVSAPWNGSTLNDTITDAFTIKVDSLLRVTPKNIYITNAKDTAKLGATSPLFPGGNVYISEIAHYKVATGAPTAGWPTYLLADDYIELTGVPNSDLDGYKYEEWNASGIQYSTTFPSGITFGSNGTMILATGQLGSSVAVPASKYYHIGNTATHGSTVAMGYIIKDPSNNIIDAVMYGAIAFPVASGVTSAHWSGTTTISSSSGIRLSGPDNNTGSTWINSSVSPQDPNNLNSGTSVPVPGSLTGFSWSFLGTTIDTNVRTQVGPYSFSGIREYVARYNNSCGVYTDTAYVHVNLLKIQSVSTTSPSCFGAGNGTATVNHTGGTAPFTYKWSVAGTSNSVSGLVAGTHGVTVTDADGAKDSASFVITTPSSSIAYSVVTTQVSGCNTNDGSFVITPSGGSNPYTFTMNGGTNFVSNSGTFSGLSSGSYLLGVKDSSGCQRLDTTPRFIVAPSAPAAPIISGTTTYCQGQSVGNLTASIGSGSSSSAYASWYNGPLLAPSDSVYRGTSFSPSITSPGTYTYYALVSDTGCKSVASTVTVVVNPRPAKPAVTASIIGYCTGDTIRPITAIGSGTINWYATAALGTPLATGASFTPAISATGNYKYYVTNTTNGCVSVTDSVRLAINSLPNVTLASFSNVCKNAPLLTLSGGAPAGGVYSGTGVSLGKFNPALANSGSHVISYRFTDANNCANTATGSITVDTSTAVTFGVLANSCSNASAFALSTGSPAGGVYSGPGVSAGFFNPAVAGVGSKQLKYAFTNGLNCTDSTFRNVQVLALPSVSIGAQASICQNSPSRVITGLNPSNGTLSASYGLISGSSYDPSASPVGVDTIMYSVTDTNGCVNTASSLIRVDSVPSVGFGSVPDVCSDRAAFALTQGTPNSNGTGNYTGTGVAGGSAFFASVAGVGTHTLTYAFTNLRGCTDSSTQTITVNAIPTVTLTAFAKACVNSGLITLTGGNPSGGTFTGNHVTAGAFNPATSGKGTFTITYTYTDVKGCSAKASKPLIVNSVPVVNLRTLSPVCLNNGPVTIPAGTPAGGTYTGNDVSGNTFSPTVVGRTIITYSFTDTNNCSNSDTSGIQVLEIPVVNLEGVEYCTGKDVVLDVSNSGKSYKWSVGDTTAKLNIKGETSGTPSSKIYTVTVTGHNGCITVDSAVVSYIGNCLSVNEVNAKYAIGLYPNPNNGQFYLELGGVEGPVLVEIINMKGQILVKDTFVSSSLEPAYIDFGDAQPGTYLLKLVINDETIIKRMIVN
ncbi:MAG: T9SS type A sorting domain-containing protein [Flavobacteriales bacterium]|nr:T9SS type A sorting domain-containing protein [Flavobacteriales bacterium]